MPKASIRLPERPVSAYTGLPVVQLNGPWTVPPVPPTGAEKLAGPDTLPAVVSALHSTSS